MSPRLGHTWALILAAGEGSRLHGLTKTASGLPVPKQFCSLTGQRSLLETTVQRARGIVHSDRVCAVVSANHRVWWENAPIDMQPSNLIVQPANRGTANGILLPLLHLIERDPEGRLIILPSDHYVRREKVLQRACRAALATLETGDPRQLVLLGVEPEAPDDQLGYIVPRGPWSASASEVAEFVEKPPRTAALDLVERGALWNVFIIAAHAKSLLQSFETLHPQVVREGRRVVQQSLRGNLHDAAAAEFYATLPHLDFSRDIAQPNPGLMRVFKVPRCGWSDLGTPQRIREVLRNASQVRYAPRRPSRSAYINLSERCAGLSA